MANEVLDAIYRAPASQKPVTPGGDHWSLDSRSLALWSLDIFLQLEQEPIPNGSHHPVLRAERYPGCVRRGKVPNLQGLHRRPARSILAASTNLVRGPVRTFFTRGLAYDEW